MSKENEGQIRLEEPPKEVSLIDFSLATSFCMRHTQRRLDSALEDLDRFRHATERIDELYKQGSHLKYYKKEGSYYAEDEKTGERIDGGREWA